MKPVYRLLIGLVLCLVFAIGSYRLATGMVESLYGFRSPLKDHSPAAGERLGAPMTRRVVFVLVDALRYDTAHTSEVMPTLAKLIAQGASAKMHSQTPSFSEPGYSTLLTGAWPYLNDGPAMNLDYADIPTWTQDNLFSSAARAGLKTAISGYYWFEKLVPQSAVTAHFYTPGEDEAADREVMDAALPWLDNPQAYQFILIHLDQVDYAGHHQGGPRDPNWNAAAKRSDDQLAEILARLDLTQDTLLIASDHGQISAGGHGGYEPDTLVEPFVLVGAGIVPGDYGDMQMVDLAPTVATLLGINLPADNQGQPLTQMLSLPPERLTAISKRQVQQQDQLAVAYKTMIGQETTASSALTGNTDPAAGQALINAARSARAGRERLLRGLLAIPLLLIASGLFYWLRGKRIAWVIAGILTYGLVFNLRYAVLDGLSYSFSSVKGPEDLILYCGTTSLMAFLAAWLVYRLGSRMQFTGPGDAASSTLSLAFGIIYALGLIALANYIINGMWVTWTLPEPRIFFLGLLALVQILFVALFGLLTAGLSAVWIWLAGFREERKTLSIRQIGK